MKRGTTLLTLLAVTCGVLLGWLTASGKLATVFAQEVKPAKTYDTDSTDAALTCRAKSCQSRNRRSMV